MPDEAAHAAAASAAAATRVSQCQKCRRSLSRVCAYLLGKAVNLWRCARETREKIVTHPHANTQIDFAPPPPSFSEQRHYQNIVSVE